MAALGSAACPGPRPVVAACLLVLAVYRRPGVRRRSCASRAPRSALKQLVGQIERAAVDRGHEEAEGRAEAGRGRPRGATRAASRARRSASSRPFRRTLRGIKVKKGRRNRRGANRLGRSAPLSMTASRALLASSRTKRCGGGVKPRSSRSRATTILQNDANGMKLRVRPAGAAVRRRRRRRAHLDEARAAADRHARRPGSPGIPVVAKTLGVPEGATLKVDATDTTSYTIDGVDVFPAQPRAGRPGRPAAAGLQRAALRDAGRSCSTAASTASGATSRPRPPTAAILGRSRDVTLANLQIPAAQYNAPPSGSKVLNSVDVTIDVRGRVAPVQPRSSSRPGSGPSGACASSLLNREADPRRTRADSSSAAARRCWSSPILRLS